MTAKEADTRSEVRGAKERPGKSATADKDPTNCDNCGNRLGMWFSLGDKAYCSPCFHAKFWTPFQSAPGKAR